MVCWILNMLYTALEESSAPCTLNNRPKNCQNACCRAEGDLFQGLWRTGLCLKRADDDRCYRIIPSTHQAENKLTWVLQMLTRPQACEIRIYDMSFSCKLISGIFTKSLLVTEQSRSQTQAYLQAWRSQKNCFLPETENIKAFLDMKHGSTGTNIHLSIWHQIKAWDQSYTRKSRAAI